MMRLPQVNLATAWDKYETSWYILRTQVVPYVWVIDVCLGPLLFSLWWDSTPGEN